MTVNFLSPTAKFGGSLTDLSVENKANDEYEEKPGLLRRAFSSRKHKKPKPTDSLVVPLATPVAKSISQPNCGCKKADGDNHREHFLQDSSSSSDLAYRRSTFSRKHYASAEMLKKLEDQSYSNNAGRFRDEVGALDQDGNQEQKTQSGQVHLENPESQTRWYFKYFLGREHHIYAGQDAERNLYALVVTDRTRHYGNQQRAILWRRNGSQKLYLPLHPTNHLSVKKILATFDLRIEKTPKEIINPEVQRDILTLEEQEGSVNFKFGVVYYKDGQTSDEEMYNNVSGSEHFNNFVSLLGERVPLRGFERFKGGLDTKGDTTGEESVYTVYEGHEIMFHVSTMLPYSMDNRQQVERKRHVGNDIVNIIFMDDCQADPSPSWRPSMMKTHFTHIFAIVIYNVQTSTYRLNIFAEESVPHFSPPLPSPPEFNDHQQFRDFLLVKLINGEKAAFHSPVFAQKRQRTMDMLLRGILETYTSFDNNKSLHRRAFSDIMTDQNGERKKDITRSLELVRVGQALKFKTILKGDAPTSLITTGTAKQKPWKPHLFFTAMTQEVICGDTWDNSLVVSTDNGTYLLEENLPSRLLIDKSVAVSQISIVEMSRVMIIRVEKGRESKICVFDLHDFCAEKNKLPYDKASIQEMKLERTKGCHLFTNNKSFLDPLRMVVAVYRKLQIYVYRCVTSCSSLSHWNQFTDSETTFAFHFLRELSTFEPAQILTLIDSHTSRSRVCVGYRNQFDLTDEQTGDTYHVYRADSARARVSCAIDVCADDEPELLFCHNRTCIFQKLTRDHGTCDNIEQSLSFNWNIEPVSLVIAFPYILAFATNAIEIRLIVNGQLVHSMAMPHVKLITSKYDIFFATSAVLTSHELGDVSKADKNPVEKVATSYSAYAQSTDDTFTSSASASPYPDSPRYNVYRIYQSSLTGVYASATHVTDDLSASLNVEFEQMDVSTPDKSAKQIRQSDCCKGIHE